MFDGTCIFKWINECLIDARKKKKRLSKIYGTYVVEGPHKIR